MDKTAILAVLRDHQADLRDRGVSRLVLFGSAARGTQGPQSDVDLAVEYGRPVGLFELARLQIDLEAMLGCRVDLVPLDGLRPEVRSALLDEGVRAA